MSKIQTPSSLDRNTRIALACAALLPLACGAPQPPDDELVAEDVCEPGEPDCDRLEQPCVADDAANATEGPGSDSMGLTTDKTKSGKYRVWPNGRVPYKIQSSVGSVTKTRLLQAMNEWETKSEKRVRFVKATASDQPILVIAGASKPITNFVGYNSSKNSRIELRNPEYITVIRHELGHALGLQHEQRRADRSNHIQVKSGNIVNTSSCKSQFNICSDCTPIKSYGVNSVMHYRTSDLSDCRNGPVLLHKDGSAIQHTWLIRKGDVAAIWELYGPPPAAGGEGGAGGAAGASGASGVGGSAGAPASGGAAGSAGEASNGGAAGSASGAAGSESGSAGDPGIQSPDDVDDGSESSADSGGCSVHGGSTGTGRGALLSLLASMLLVGRRRRRGHGGSTNVASHDRLGSRQ